MPGKNFMLALVAIALLIGTSLYALAVDDGESEVKLVKPIEGIVIGGEEEPGGEPMDEERPGMVQVLGFVWEGRFHPVIHEEGIVSEMPLRLTGIQMQESVPPETQEIDLSEFEGHAIMIDGLDGGGWLYDVRIIDVAGPILTAVVEKVFLGEHIIEE